MQDKKIILSDLSVNDMNVIMAGLGKLPMEVVIDLWARIKAQAESQLTDGAE